MCLLGGSGCDPFQFARKSLAAYMLIPAPANLHSIMRGGWAFRFHRYTASGSPVRVWEGDFYAGKGVGMACIASPGGHIHVYNTHTAANYGHDYTRAEEKGDSAVHPPDTCTLLRHLQEQLSCWSNLPLSIIVCSGFQIRSTRHYPLEPALILLLWTAWQRTSFKRLLNKWFPGAGRVARFGSRLQLPHKAGAVLGAGSICCCSEQSGARSHPAKCSTSK